MTLLRLVHPNVSRHARTLARSLLYAATLCAVAAAAGGLAAAARPTGSTAGARPDSPGAHPAAVTAPTTPAGDGAGGTGVDSSTSAWADPAFLHSMVLSGAVALALSLVGTAVVLRRRRYW